MTMELNNVLNAPWVRLAPSGRRRRRRGQRGFRHFGGKQYLLFSAMNLWGGDDEARLQSEAAAARKRWELVRIVRDRRRYRAFIYVFGEK